MNILLISVIFPYPINDGGSSGTYYMIDSLRKNHNITFVGPDPGREHKEELIKLWPDVDIICYGHAKDKLKVHPIKKLVKSLQPKPVVSEEQEFMKSMLINCTDLVNYYFEELIDIVKNTFAKKTIDLVKVEFIDMAPIVHFLPAHIPKVFVHHEIRYKRMELEFSTLEKGNNAELWKINNIKILEIGLLNKFDTVICLSDIDKDYLIKDGVTASKIEVSALPVLLPKHNLNIPFQFKNRLIFLGPEAHFPNLDGINWFLKNAWEKILAINPNLELDIIGKWSQACIEKLSIYPNITFSGYIENLEDKMDGSIMIVPIRIGSGMRMKILEGVSWHVPIVSTRIGAEGIPLKDGENCFFADEADDFVQKIIELSGNKDLQNNFISGSKNIIEENFTQQKTVALREAIMLGIISSLSI